MEKTISIHALREEGDIRQREDWTTRIISIHALREEGDYTILDILRNKIDFYPRPPRGGRPDVNVSHEEVVDISIHALREEGDRAESAQKAAESAFLSTPSARRATLTILVLLLSCVISIHALREEGDGRQLRQT